MKIRDIKIPEILKNKYLAAILIFGAVLLLLGRKSTGEAAVPSTSESTIFELEQSEKELEEILSQISGVGKVRVSLSIKSSGEQVILSDSKTSVKNSSNGDISSENTVSALTVSSGSGIQSVVPLKYIYPEYLGALIVCEGGDSASIQLLVTDAVGSLTGLSSDKITVVKMKE